MLHATPATTYPSHFQPPLPYPPRHNVPPVQSLRDSAAATPRRAAAASRKFLKPPPSAARGRCACYAPPP